MTIKTYQKNSAYWQYQGEPVVLIGGSDDDNLFQWTGEKLTKHLDLLASLGGNYVRNTMSDRDEGNVYAFKEIEQKKFDLDKWNEEYWNRLEFFLQETKNRDIIVQLTFWDQHDLSGPWKKHPWNPENNINLNQDDLTDAGNFCRTVKDNNKKVLSYQKKYIEKLISITFQFPHVLYNINNESWAGIEWENYWVKYLHQKATEADVHVEVTTMQMNAESAIRSLMEYPDLYSYADISQNNQNAFGKSGQAHMDAILLWRKNIHSFFEEPRPLNNIKVYGSGAGENGSAGTGLEATERFWRNIFGGCASTRFHRPAVNWGLGLGPLAQKHIKAMCMLLDELDIFKCQPFNELLVEEPEETYSTPREANQAYCLAAIGYQYAVYFRAGGTVKLDPWIYQDKTKVRWLNINENNWSEKEDIKVRWAEKHNVKLKSRITLVNPVNSPRVALVEVE